MDKAPDYESGDCAGSTPVAPTIQTKTCWKCQTIKPTSDFSVNKTKSDGLQTQCRRCRKTYHTAYYTKEKRAHLVRNAKTKRIKRQFVYDYLKTHPCVDCGESDPTVLTFDHVRGRKLFTIASGHNTKNLDTIKKEIAKCDVVCANCHTRRTARQFGWYQDLEQ